MLDRGEGIEESTGGVERDVDPCLDCILQAGSAAPKLAGLALSVVPWDGTDLPLRDIQEGDTSTGGDTAVVGNVELVVLLPYCDVGMAPVRWGARMDAELLVAGGIFLKSRKKSKDMVQSPYYFACFQRSTEHDSEDKAKTLA